VYVRNMPTIGVDPSGRFLNLGAAAVGFGIGVLAYGAGTIVGNALQGNALDEGLNPGDAFMAGATGAMMGATAGMGLLTQTAVSASLSSITTAASMGLGGRTNTQELGWGAIFGIGGPLLDAIPIPGLRLLPFRQAAIALGRGFLTSAFLTAGQGVLSMDDYYLATGRASGGKP
jgi:hypothetical protein